MINSSSKAAGSVPRLVSAKHCVRCIRNRSTAAIQDQHEVKTDPVNYKNEFRLARSRSYTNKLAIGKGITTSPTDVNIDKGEGSSRTTLSSHVWGRMQDSPERQCILTRKTFPSDYLIQLKPRYYPRPTPGTDSSINNSKSNPTAKSGIYLKPNLIKREDGGRSYYLTLHRQIVSRLKEPGSHLGILQQNEFLIPSKIDDWIRNQLAEKLIEEVEKLASELQKHMTKVKNMSFSADEIGVITRYIPNESEEELELDRLIIRLPGDNANVNANSPTVVDLSDFPALHRPALFKALSRVLCLERKYTLRQAIVNGSDLSLPHLRHLIGKSSNSNTLKESTIAISSSTTRGQLALPTMIALLRWKLYSGQGWESESKT